MFKKYKKFWDILLVLTLSFVALSTFAPISAQEFDHSTSPNLLSVNDNDESLIWEKLYNIAKEKLNPRMVSHFIEAGQVACALLTEQGNIYTGANIESKCDWGMCAERSAVANIIANGENKILKMVTVNRNGLVILPCGICRESLSQLDKSSENIEFLVNLETKETVKLGELLPNWWGKDKF